MQSLFMASQLVKNRVLEGPVNELLSDAAHEFWSDRNALLIITSCHSLLLFCWVPGIFRTLMDPQLNTTSFTSWLYFTVIYSAPRVRVHSARTAQSLSQSVRTPRDLYGVQAICANSAK